MVSKLEQMQVPNGTGPGGILLLRNGKLVEVSFHICDMEVEIVTFVVKGSAQLTVTLDRQESIQVGSRGVVLSRVFNLKLSGIHLTQIINVWQIELFIGGLYSEGSENRFMVV